MIREVLSKLGGEGFGSNCFPLRLLLRWFVIQKIIGLNRHVSWPVHWTSKIVAPENIIRGTRFPGLGSGCHIDGRNGIEFGNNVWIGPRVSIISMNHDLNCYFRYKKADPIKIGSNCWLGVNAVILPSVILGEHTIVAAGAVVTKEFPEGNQVLAGVPAKVVKKLPEYSTQSIPTNS